jgi:DNA-binding CsgD family transcriptional regulator
MRPERPESSVTGLLILIVAQSACAAFFLADAIADLRALGLAAFGNWHLAVETVAALGLAAAVAVEVRMVLRLLRRQAHLARSVSIASGALHDVIDAHFDAWALTPAERDVALFTIKGLSIGEIAEIRGAAPGTVKAQLNAIYRKSGVSGRTGLLALLIDDLLGGPLLPGAGTAA